MLVLTVRNGLGGCTPASRVLPMLEFVLRLSVLLVEMHGHREALPELGVAYTCHYVYWDRSLCMLVSWLY